MRFFRKKQEPKGMGLTLEEAVSRGLVKFELRGLGEGVTSKAELQLTKLTDEPLTILVPRGTKFVPVAKKQARQQGS